MSDTEKPISILIVDDEDRIRQLLRLTLVRAGYDVVEAESGAEGVRIIQEQAPDLVFLDVMMPEMDGFATCRQIREDAHGNRIPIIMLSARKDARSRQQSRQAGANAYLTKPWNTDELLWHVEDKLRGSNNLQNHGTS